MSSATQAFPAFSWRASTVAPSGETRLKSAGNINFLSASQVVALGIAPISSLSNLFQIQNKEYGHSKVGKVFHGPQECSHPVRCYMKSNMLIKCRQMGFKTTYQTVHKIHSCLEYDNRSPAPFEKFLYSVPNIFTFRDLSPPYYSYILNSHWSIKQIQL